MPERVVAALMGHANSAMVRRVYGRIGDQAQRAAIEKLPALGLGPGEPSSTVSGIVQDSAS